MALGIDVGSTGVLLVDDGDTLERIPTRLPSRRVAREVVSRMGDTVEIVHRLPDGEVREELAQSLFADAAETGARTVGVEPPTTGGLGIVVAVPAWWTSTALDLAGGVLRERLGARAQLLPDAVAAVLANPAVASAPREVVAVVDVGASTTSVALVADAGSPRPRLRARGDVATGRSGDHLAHLVMHHVLTGSQINARDLDATDPRTAEQARALLRNCERATRRLSHQSAVEIDAEIADQPIHVRLVRAELDEIGRPWSEDVVERLGAQLRACDVDVRRALIVGGAAHLPMFAQSISGELGLEVTVDPRPAEAFARGAARAGGSVDHRRAVPRRGLRPGPARRPRSKGARLPLDVPVADLTATDTELPPSLSGDTPSELLPATGRVEIEPPPVDAPSAGRSPTDRTEPAALPAGVSITPTDATVADPTARPGDALAHRKTSTPSWSQIRPESSDTDGPSIAATDEGEVEVEVEVDGEDAVEEGPVDDVGAAPAPSRRARRYSPGRRRRIAAAARTDDDLVVPDELAADQALPSTPSEGPTTLDEVPDYATDSTADDEQEEIGDDTGAPARTAEPSKDAEHTDTSRRRRRGHIVLVIAVVLVATFATWAYGTEPGSTNQPSPLPSATSGPPTPAPTPTPTLSPAADPTTPTSAPRRVDGSSRSQAPPSSPASTSGSSPASTSGSTSTPGATPDVPAPTPPATQSPPPPDPVTPTPEPSVSPAEDTTP